MAPLGTAIARQAAFSMIPWPIHVYPDGGVESCVEKVFSSTPLDCVYVLGNTESIWHVLLAIRSFQRAKVSRIILILPWIPYARSHQWEALHPLQYLADLIESAGATELVTVDWHVSFAASLFRIPVQSISSHEWVARDIQARFQQSLMQRKLAIVSPDQGRLAFAAAVCERLGCDLVLLQKTRTAACCSISKSLGEIANRHCIVVDDVIASGQTLQSATQFLHDHHACDVDAYITHDYAAKSFTCPGLKSLSVFQSVYEVMEDSVNQKRHHVRYVHSMAPLIAQSIMA